MKKQRRGTTPPNLLNDSDSVYVEAFGNEPSRLNDENSMFSAAQGI